MPEDHRPGGAGITKFKEALRKIGVAERRYRGASLRKTRRDVQKGLEQGECLKKPLGKHSGKKGRNHLGFNTGQRGPEEPRSRQACQKKKQKRCTECGKSFKSYSRFVNN